MPARQLPRYGLVRTPEELGALLRAHRKVCGLTLEQTAGVGNSGTRFLSELERGKPTVRLGKTLETLRLLGLEVVIVPRGEAERMQRLVETPRRSERD